MNWLKKLMDGRYGYDELSIMLIALSFLPMVIAGFSKRIQISSLTYVLLGLCIYRTLSKQIERRSLENQKFMIWLSLVYPYIEEIYSGIKNFINYKYFKCPNCQQKLRAPRGEGKVVIICSNCNTKFTEIT